MKYLIVGLGNPGSEYQETRHNIGFKVLDALARASNSVFSTQRLGDVTTVKHKGRQLILLKPNTFMNLSGKAIQYWMVQEKIPLENIFVVTDDLALDYGTIRIRGKGSDGGHNGLKDTQRILNTTNYARLRFGIGDTFSKGKQVDYVLGEWTDEEKVTLEERIKLSADACLSFAFAGLTNTMNTFNGK